MFNDVRYLRYVLPDLRLTMPTFPVISDYSPAYSQAVRSLTEDASKTLIQAFVSCRLDYCNSLFFGDRAFGAAGPELWNNLPSHLKDADISYSEFRRSLKTFLFGQWGHGAVLTVLIAPTRNIHTYLLTYSRPTWCFSTATMLFPYKKTRVPVPSTSPAAAAAASRHV